MISIIVPVYNAEKFLSECVDSILRQEFKDFELVLVNDGSSDRSPMICDAYAEQDDRIKVIHKTNSGVSSARNCGLDVCKGEWIAFADADDFFTETAFEKFHEASKKQNDLILFNAIKKKGNLTKTLFNYHIGTRPMFQMVTNRAVWAHLFRRSVIQQNHIRFAENLTYSEDTIFLYHFMAHCKNIWQSDDVVYVYRIHENSACASSDGLKQACSQIMAVVELRSVLNRYFPNTVLKSIIHYETKRLLCMGFYRYVCNPFDKGSYRILKKFYFEYMGNGIKSYILFYYCMLSQYLLFQRRKIIQINE